MSDHKATIEAMYAAFGRGDVAAILERLSPDVAWEQWPDLSAQAAGVPWLQERHGREGALEFFKIVGQWKFQEFRVASIMTGGNDVAVLIIVDAEIPGSGVRMRDEEMHLWTFGADGLVARFRHYADTAKHIAAARAGA